MFADKIGAVKATYQAHAVGDVKMTRQGKYLVPFKEVKRVLMELNAKFVDAAPKEADGIKALADELFNKDETKAAEALNALKAADPDWYGGLGFE